MQTSRLSIIDQVILRLDSFWRGSGSTISDHSQAGNPAISINNPRDLTIAEQRDSVRMLRINHAGEICAQALYQGQALTARTIQQHNTLLQAAAEENAHLQWCHTRLQELNGRPSLLNPIWYAGSFAIGAMAGLAGDRISMGFLAETEYQVSAHLAKHLRRISDNDQKSRAILEQMRADELRHATTAIEHGAVALPLVIKWIMRGTAKILTITAARI